MDYFQLAMLKVHLLRTLQVGIGGRLLSLCPSRLPPVQQSPKLQQTTFSLRSSIRQELVQERRSSVPLSKSPSNLKTGRFGKMMLFAAATHNTPGHPLNTILAVAQEKPSLKHPRDLSTFPWTR